MTQNVIFTIMVLRWLRRFSISDKLEEKLKHMKIYFLVGTQVFPGAVVVLLLGGGDTGANVNLSIVCNISSAVIFAGRPSGISI
jgi:hypothetical protein